MEKYENHFSGGFSGVFSAEPIYLESTIQYKRPVITFIYVDTRF